MYNKRMHWKNATYWNKCKHVGSTLLSACYMQLTTKFRMVYVLGFSTSSCHWLQDGAEQKLLGSPDPGFRRCCSVQHSHVQLLTLMALHCHKVMGHPRLPPGASSGFILGRCVAFTPWLSDTERFGCSASSLQAWHTLKLSLWVV